MTEYQALHPAGTTVSPLKCRFHELVAIWKRERGPHSSSARLAEHPAYLELIRMGPEVVPLWLGELEREPDHWFRALHALTGANPMPPESRQGSGDGCGVVVPGTRAEVSMVRWPSTKACSLTYGSVVQFLRRSVDTR
jgi:hypothetical protein